MSKPAVFTQYDYDLKALQVGLRFFVNPEDAELAGPAIAQYYGREVEREIYQALVKGRLQKKTQS